MSRRERLGAALGCALVTTGFLAMAVDHGALGASRNDDWTYYRVVFDMAQHGRFAPDPYTQTMLLGQALMAQPVIAVFGAELAPLQFLVALLGAVGLLATYAVIRSFLGIGQTVLAVAVLVLGPIYGSAATSFMTDVPAFAFQALALAATLKALRPEPLALRWLVAAYALSLVAFSIREYAAAAALAITLALLWTRRSTGLGWVRLLALPVLWVVLAGSLFAVRGSLTGGGAPEPLEEILSVATLRHAARTVATLSLLVVPVGIPVVAALVRGPARHRRLWAVGGLVAGVVGASVLVLAVPEVRPLGNYLTAFGSYPETLAGPQERLWAEPVWEALTAAMLVVTGLLVWLAFRLVTSRGAQPGAMRAASLPVGLVLSMAFALTVLATTVAVTTVAVGTPFDRYLLPATPFLAAAVLFAADRLTPTAVWASQPWRLATVATLAVYAVVGLRTVDASATFDGAKWRLGEVVADQGVEPSTINAGLEWFGLHQDTPIVVGPERDGRFGFWVTRLFANPLVCVGGVYERGVPFGSPVVARVSAHGWFGTTSEVVAYRVSPECATP